MVMAYWGVGLLIRATNALPFPLPYWVVFKIDAPVLAFTVNDPRPGGPAIQLAQAGVAGMFSDDPGGLCQTFGNAPI